jgi:hypothetical protein
LLLRLLFRVPLVLLDLRVLLVATVAMAYRDLLDLRAFLVSRDLLDLRDHLDPQQQLLK